MNIRRQVSATARKKHLKVQLHKVNSRRQFFFNQENSLSDNKATPTQTKSNS